MTPHPITVCLLNHSSRERIKPILYANGLPVKPGIGAHLKRGHFKCSDTLCLHFMTKITRPLLAVSPQVSYLTSLYLSFTIHKMGIKKFREICIHED